MTAPPRSVPGSTRLRVAVPAEPVLVEARSSSGTREDVDHEPAVEVAPDEVPGAVAAFVAIPILDVADVSTAPSIHLVAALDHAVCMARVVDLARTHRQGVPVRELPDLVEALEAIDSGL